MSKIIGYKKVDSFNFVPIYDVEPPKTNNMSNQISATVICDSINEYNDRITTVECVVPRIVLAEFNTHRMFSRNSASSRAIPAKKIRDMVQENPFVPIKWMKEHKGMQGTDYFTDELSSYDGGKSEIPLVNMLNHTWLQARDSAIEHAGFLSEDGLTKQLANRLLEPFMYHKILVTATDWGNFTALRAHEAAEIHIQDFAYKLIEALNNSTPKPLKSGEWHLPYGDKIVVDHPQPIEDVLKICTARCAQTSYSTIGDDGKPMDYEKLVNLHDRLLANGHVSPFEHCARAMSWEEYGYFTKTVPAYDGNGHIAGKYTEQGWSGNFSGWIQYRKLLPNENRTDSRIIKKKYNG